jgi:hypothetical protein
MVLGARRRVLGVLHRVLGVPNARALHLLEVFDSG